MNLGKHTRLKIYNARLLLHNAANELDSTNEDNLNVEDNNIINHWALRIHGIEEELRKILRISKNDE